MPVRSLNIHLIKIACHYRTITRFARASGYSCNIFTSFNMLRQPMRWTKYQYLELMFITHLNMAVKQENKLFPVFLKLENFRVLIVGGGKVGLEKVSAIVANSPLTRITLVATQINADLKSLAQKNENIFLKEREFNPNDLSDQDLVIIAVNNKDTS